MKALVALSLHIVHECVLALLVDVSGELLDLREEMRLCWIVALFFGGPLLAQSQPGLDQIQNLFCLCDGHLETLSDPLLAGKLWQNLEETDASHQGQSVFSHNSKLVGNDVSTKQFYTIKINGNLRSEKLARMKYIRTPLLRKNTDGKKK